MASAWQRVLQARTHIVAGSLAASPGHIVEHFPTPAAALNSLVPWLQGLPDPLLAHWLAIPGGHVVLNAERHGFTRGESTYGDRTLEDVAWLRLALYPQDRLAYLSPLGYLIACLLGWPVGGPASRAPILKAWEDFTLGVQDSFRPGYGLSDKARTDETAYLAESIAAYLDDRRSLNARDPRIEKLLAATVFKASSYLASPKPPKPEL